MARQNTRETQDKIIMIQSVTTNSKLDHLNNLECCYCNHGCEKEDVAYNSHKNLPLQPQGQRTDV